MPVSTRNGPTTRFRAAIWSSWARSRAAESPFATVSRGEWSVIAR